MLHPPGAPGAEADRFAAVVESVRPGPAHWTVGVRYLEGDAAFKVFVMPPEITRLGLAPGPGLGGHRPRRIRLHFRS